MRSVLNGQQETVDDATSVTDLLRKLELDPIRVAVEINEDVLRRSTFTDTAIREGDRVEIVTFVGGG